MTKGLEHLPHDGNCGCSVEHRQLGGVWSRVCLMGGKGDRVRLFPVLPSDSTRDNEHKVKQRGFH